MELMNENIKSNTEESKQKLIAQSKELLKIEMKIKKLLNSQDNSIKMNSPRQTSNPVKPEPPSTNTQLRGTEQTSVSGDDSRPTRPRRDSVLDNPNPISPSRRETVEISTKERSGSSAPKVTTTITPLNESDSSPSSSRSTTPTNPSTSNESPKETSTTSRETTTRPRDTSTLSRNRGESTTSITPRNRGESVKTRPNATTSSSPNQSSSPSTKNLNNVQVITPISQKTQTSPRKNSNAQKPNELETLAQVCIAIKSSDSLQKMMENAQTLGVKVQEKASILKKFHSAISDPSKKKEIVSNLNIFQNAVKELGGALKFHRESGGQDPKSAENVGRLCLSLMKVNFQFFDLFFFGLYI